MGEEFVRQRTHPPRKDILIKGLTFAVTLEQIPVVDIITGTESALRNSNLADPEAKLFRLNI